MPSNVNIYTYTASANPYFVKSLAHKYGYTFDRDQSLSSVLQQLVSMEGESVLMEIVENNPDKDLFMEYYEKKYAKKQEEKKEDSKLLEYMNFSGQIQAAQQTADNKRLTSETSIMVLAGAILIAFAIISKK
jgi:hypothetical protein